jgi:cellulose biosynthesis protein BcsQ/cytochrome c-type biogenesis protein CcmH/NrfG
MAFYVAFYSYKGGVGRTLALANTAYSLAEHGKRVVLVDMDLEAPGLSEYKEFAVRAKNPKGFVEYAAHYRQTGKCPALKSYVHACKESPGTGQLWLMPAGAVGAAYQKQLADLSWRKLHPQKGTVPFLEDFKKALAEEYRPDYVLIDSRTGLSDIGGLSTHQIANFVVLVFNLTRSCLEGSARTYRSFVSETSKAGFLQLVASPVPPLPPSPDSLIERQLSYACEHMPLGVAYGRTILRIDYNPAMVLAEELAVRHPAVFPAAERYEALREAIQRVNKEEVFPVLERVRELRNAGQLEDGLTQLRTFVEDHPGNAEGLLELGNLLMEIGQVQEAIPIFQKACEIAPGIARIHLRLGEALASAGRNSESLKALQRAENLGEKSQALYLSLSRVYPDQGNELPAREFFGKALTHFFDSAAPSDWDPRLLRREFIEILGRLPPYSGFSPETFWDSLMGSLSLKVGEKAEILKRVLRGKINPQQIVSLMLILNEEQKKWVEALGPTAKNLMQRVAEHVTDPNDVEALLKLRAGNQGDAALTIFATAIGKLPGDRRIKLLNEALQPCPGNVELLLALGSALQEQAQRLSSSDKEGRERTLIDVCLKYEEVLRQKPDQHSALYNWGIALGRLADLTEGEDKRRLLLEACLKYEEALRHKPDKHEALNNWGTALVGLSDLAEGEDKRRLIHEACLRYEEAQRHRPDKHEALYNWGLALERLAVLAEGGDKRRLLFDACLKYEEALRHKPDKHEALNNWGNALGRLAELTEGKDRGRLLLAACLKYEEALRHKPDKHEALDSWASALLKLWYVTEDAQARTALLQEAAEKARRASDIAPGKGDYNLACAKSLLDEFEEAARLVTAYVERRPDMAGHALQDPDFSSLWKARPHLRAKIEASLAAGPS